MVVILGAIAGATLIGLPAVMVMSVMGGSTNAESSCTSSGTVLADSAAVDDLDDSQRAIAATIIDQGRRLGVSPRGLLVALAVAAQESRFTVYANDGSGELASDQAGIERSLSLPHTAVGSDHGSLGVFQQQWPWWGTMQQLMDPATSARLFFQHLLVVPGWQAMEIGEAGQRVQRSAFPDAYDDDVPLAEALLDAAGGANTEPTAYFGSVDPSACGLSVADGDVVFPLAPGISYVDQENFGGVSSFWSTTHTGTDFSTACGGTVLAATSGVVTVDTTEAWAGTWLVEIDSGAVVTWYAHMQSIDVEDGQQVVAGQVLGAVGDLGNATGCHLHFEVQRGGGDPVDPTPWLLEHVSSRHEPEVVAVGASQPDQQTLRVAVIRGGSSKDVTRGLARRPDLLIALDAPRTPALDAPWSTLGGGDQPLIVWDADVLSLGRSVDQRGRTAWALFRTDAGTLPALAATAPRALRELTGSLSAAGYPPLVAAPVGDLRQAGLAAGAATCGSLGLTGDADYLHVARTTCNRSGVLLATVSPADPS
ncbi:M23 family metallopeptidase [Nocardioides bruguierae]|uniref:M23 family metallopeptidase n=1 Tax=Nocardioides bruguierae TaxID=2945102 RepID=A0A9X2DAZ5_9ACTN|nr:M23 family metallopeptidase [Nocardioides bruguierae]MCM0622533.1 M23 family metallopeptidase [Nocardioides bruguierae]